jgi:hypothetical protein
MAAVNPPILLALLLCDSTIREVGTNKLSLIGTFNGLFSRNFPCTHPSLTVYAALTDGRGRVPCQLRMHYAETRKEVLSLKGHVDFHDPTGVAELIFQLQQLTFERPGDYEIEFIAEGELLGTRKLRVQTAPQLPGGESGKRPG